MNTESIYNTAKIMGILNVTPDSFSDGGQYNTPELAFQKALEMQQQGADIIDIGGQSTGPGSPDITEEEELERTIPVIQKIRQHSDIQISIDTYYSQVAEQAIKAGANIINDVTALRQDPKIADIAAKHKTPIILMYAKDNTPRTTTKATDYQNLIETIKTFLTKQIHQAKQAGIPEQNIIIDPGMGGFISSKAHYSYQLLAELAQLKTLNHQILIGISRKSFLKLPMNQRDQAALPLTAIAINNGASIIRTHAPGLTKQYLSQLT